MRAKLTPLCTAAYAAPTTLVTMSPNWASACLAASPLNWPVSTAFMTSCRYSGGTFNWISRVVRKSRSLVLNRDPSAATPMTVPTSRAVVVADAAMPECLAGRADRATEVMGTTAMPNPTPASSSENIMGR